METHHVELSSKASRDLRDLKNRKQLERIKRGLAALAEKPTPGNLDIKPVTDRAPYLRMRVGEWRILYRPLTEREIQILVLRRGSTTTTTGFLVARIINRKDLERAIATLELAGVLEIVS
jgi:mRNA-degrading endonuclease RelE of RelBE toxin-antitoxin system